MKIIPRYVLKHFLSVLGVTLFAFLGLYLVVDFFEKFDSLLGKQVLFSDSIRYFAFRMPLILGQGIPVSILLATLISMGILNRNREIIALKASGVGAASYGAPILVASILLSMVHFGISETVARPLNHRAEEIWQKKVEKRINPMGWSKENVWFRGKDLIYQIRVYNQRTLTLERVSIYFLGSDFKLVRRLDAKRVRWAGNRWIAEDGMSMQLHSSDARTSRFVEQDLEVAETPEDFKTLETIPQELNWLDLYSYIAKLRQEGYSALRYQVDWHLRLAFPLTGAILALLGLAVAMHLGHRGGIAVGVGIGIVVAGLYLTAIQVGGSLGTAGIAPPYLAVWSSNVLFGAVGLWLVRRAPQ
jgi:lipopolysaccharide export system permease protein